MNKFIAHSSKFVHEIIFISILIFFIYLLLLCIIWFKQWLSSSHTNLTFARPMKLRDGKPTNHVNRTIDLIGTTNPIFPCNVIESILILNSKRANFDIFKLQNKKGRKTLNFKTIHILKMLYIFQKKKKLIMCKQKYNKREKKANMRHAIPLYWWFYTFDIIPSDTWTNLMNERKNGNNWFISLGIFNSCIVYIIEYTLRWFTF